MNIPDKSHPGWIKAITAEETPDYKLLATKILIGRLTLAYQVNPSPEAAKGCAAELWAFFIRNKNLPKAQADLEKIFGEAVIK